MMRLMYCSLTNSYTTIPIGHLRLSLTLFRSCSLSRCSYYIRKSGARLTKGDAPSGEVRTRRPEVLEVSPNFGKCLDLPVESGRQKTGASERPQYTEENLRNFLLQIL